MYIHLIHRQTEESLLKCLDGLKMGFCMQAVSILCYNSLVVMLKPDIFQCSELKTRTMAEAL